MLLQEQASRLQQVIAEAQSSAPRRAEGADSRGAVHVRLGPDGLPDSFRVADDWHRKVSAGAFAGAVSEACVVAARQRMDAWATALQRDGWQSRVDRLRSQLDQPAAGMAGTPVSGEVPPAFAPRRPVDTPRPLDVLTDDALRVFDATASRAASAPAPPQGSGTGAGGSLVLTLSASSLLSCRADPRWVSGQTAARLTRALREALAAARASLAGTAVAAAGDATRQSAVLGQIFDEALALINENRSPSRNGAPHDPVG
jgi:hypothetical protein